MSSPLPPSGAPGPPAGPVVVEGLTVDPVLHRFVADELLPGSGVDEARFWRGLASLVDAVGDRHRRLLVHRDRLQAELDGWHRHHRHERPDRGDYRRFLEGIGYLEPPAAEVEVTTAGVDAEVAEVAGPQLIVPATNARYALNAANARWGSLYDALYGTDALGSSPPVGPYDPARGRQVVAWTRRFLDDVVPLAGGSHAEARRYALTGGRLAVELADGTTVGLRDPAGLAGHRGPADEPSAVVLRHHRLHVELVVDRSDPVGAVDPAGLRDVVVESAVTTIVDCEDSVATVDADDKVVAYRTWLGLMTGELAATFEKGGRPVARRLADDRPLTAPDGRPLLLPGRALLMVRHVGAHLSTDAVLDRRGRAVPEGLVDAMVTVAAALHDGRRPAAARNSRHGSIYVVKPKLHGSAEVALTGDVLAHVEGTFGLDPGTIKVGLMDEERRTTLNLRQCVAAAGDRLAFVNTGFLDRTGDEIHSSMEAGAMVRKGDMKSARWFGAYEDQNVDVGLACGLGRRGQIGKGMWAATDRMAAMLAEKIAQPQAGASCAWVPSPTAATLHATHYHRVDVRRQQDRLAAAGPRPADGLLDLPLATGSWHEDEITDELDNNLQGILGYVVRWVDQGIGCSKVPDLHDVALMEDRATCRISSQHVANWLHHGIVDDGRVRAAMARMAAAVDRQNADDPSYRPMAPALDGPAFQAACELVFGGRSQPSGYTEPVLHAARRRRKRLLATAAGPTRGATA